MRQLSAARSSRSVHFRFGEQAKPRAFVTASWGSFGLRNVYLILAMAFFVSGCSSQQLSWFAGGLLEVINPPRNSYGAEYDEEAIFPVPNQRLACETDWTCKKPLSETEFDRLSDEEQFRVVHGDDLKPID